MSNQIVLNRGDKLVLRDVLGNITIFSWSYGQTLTEGNYLNTYSSRYTFTKKGNLKFSEFRRACQINNYIIIRKCTLKKLTLKFLKDEYPEFFI
jgi:hypothetical protein